MADNYHVHAELADAFEQAVAATTNWRYGEHEPQVFYKRGSVDVKAVCIGAMIFPDSVPDKIYTAVDWLAFDFQDGPESLNHNCSGPNDHSYGNVAKCLLRLYLARKDYFRRRAELSRDFRRPVRLSHVASTDCSGLA